MDIESLERRAGIIRGIRAFFDKKKYLEVDTPILSPDLIPENCLEVFETRGLHPAGSRKKEQKLYLVPSPEIWMKKLIARHKTSMYQICKCFRNGESEGRIHSREFTMLEYYTMNADYLDSLALTEELFRHSTGLYPQIPWLSPPFVRISMEEAFIRWAGFSLAETAVHVGAMEAEARRLGLDPPPGLDTAALYDLVFIHAVEPRLPKNKVVALIDYPAFVPCLAQDGGQNGNYAVKERWELYANGIELANCFSEETDPEKVRLFFEQERVKKEKALVRHHVDDAYWKIFAGFPRCSGVALGLDRFIMALTGKASIDSIITDYT